MTVREVCAFSIEPALSVALNLPLASVSFTPYKINFRKIVFYSVPNERQLNEPGRKDGDTVIVKENNRVKAYRWSARDFQWKLVGDVVESKAENPSDKTTLNGVKYDYVFSVDVEQGAPLLKLPYNKGQDPYVAAMQFLIDNNLEAFHLDRVFMLYNIVSFETRILHNYVYAVLME